MRIVSRSLAVGLVIVASLALAGCGAANSTPAPVTQPATGGVEQKMGNTTKTGQVTQTQGKFYLTVAGQPPQEIDSYSIDLAQYVNQTVTITGQFSGNTLFVGEVK